jgi:hypothetical protein
LFIVAGGFIAIWVALLVGSIMGKPWKTMLAAFTTYMVLP